MKIFVTIYLLCIVEKLVAIGFNIQTVPSMVSQFPNIVIFIISI